MVLRLEHIGHADNVQFRCEIPQTAAAEDREINPIKGELFDGKALIAQLAVVIDRSGKAALGSGFYGVGKFFQRDGSGIVRDMQVPASQLARIGVKGKPKDRTEARMARRPDFQKIDMCNSSAVAESRSSGLCESLGQHQKMSIKFSN